MVSYLASAETVLDFLLFDETAVHDDKLPAMTVCVIFLPANTFGRKENHRNSCGRKLFLRKQNHANSLGRKPFLVDRYLVGSMRCGHS